jgi:endogenous inhibitor of DNA gyrase (YacG/DUF329 family)
MLRIVCPGCNKALQVETNDVYLQYTSYICPNCATPINISNKNDAIKYWSKVFRDYNASVHAGEAYCEHCPFDFLHILLAEKKCDACMLFGRTKSGDLIDLERWCKKMMPQQQLSENT